MGWNSGYTIFEATVIGSYNLGKLDKELLTVLMEPYRGSDIDSGGSHNLKSNDGKAVDQIVIETWGLAMPDKPAAKYDGNPDAWEDYYEDIYDLMSKVTDYFNWC